MRRVALEQGTPEWLAWRQTRRMASETPCVLGISPWAPRTHAALALRKRSGSGIPDNKAMRWGRQHEQDGRAAAEAMLGEPLEPCCVEDVGGSYAASLDGITFRGDVITEVKCPYSGAGSDYYRMVAECGTPPASAFAQVQHQLMVSGASRCLFVVWTPATVVHCWVEPDPEQWAVIRSAWDAFWPLMSPDACLDDYIERDDDAWRDVAIAWRRAKADLDVATEAEKHQRDRLVALADGNTVDGAGLRVIATTRNGTIYYQVREAK